MIYVVCVLSLFMSALLLEVMPVQADSLRCPNAKIEGRPLTPKEQQQGMTVATPEELSAIDDWWRDLDDKSNGGDGPLGCPRGGARPINDDPSHWQGIQQVFQRGQILIGRGNSAGIQVLGIRGLGRWTIVQKGLTGHLTTTPTILNNDHIRNSAKWKHDGVVMYAPSSEETIGLWSCKYLSKTDEWVAPCNPVIPLMTGSGQIFDVAARSPPTPMPR